jgi:hypothetical protein
VNATLMPHAYYGKTIPIVAIQMLCVPELDSSDSRVCSIQSTPRLMPTLPTGISQPVPGVNPNEDFVVTARVHKFGSYGVPSPSHSQ